MEQRKLRTNRKNDGKKFENQISESLFEYQRQRLMRVKKVEQPIRMFGRRVIHLKNPFLDYIGCWTERFGRMVAFEAKSTSKPTLQTHSGGLTEAQIDALRWWKKSGAIVFMLWQFGGQVKLWTYEMIEEQTRERRHLKFDDGLPVPVIQDTTKVEQKLFVDFRSVMLEVF